MKHVLHSLWSRASNGYRLPHDAFDLLQRLLREMLIACQGGLCALNPNNGSCIWQHCMMAGPVLGAVSVVPGVVAITEGNYLLIVDAKSASTLYRFQDTQGGGTFYGGASVSNGVL